MSRIHGHHRNSSISMKPYTTTIPTFMDLTIQEVKKLVVGLSNKGISGAEIGRILRDEHGIGSVKDILGKNLLEFLKENNAAPIIPDQLNDLISRVSVLRNHISSNNKDKSAKFRLGLISSRLYRLVRYYKEKKQLPASWKLKEYLS